jgi:flagellar biosynthesis GTPase FlhF
MLDTNNVNIIYNNDNTIINIPRSITEYELTKFTINVNYKSKYNNNEYIVNINTDLTHKNIYFGNDFATKAIPKIDSLNDLKEIKIDINDNKYNVETNTYLQQQEHKEHKEHKEQSLQQEHKEQIEQIEQIEHKEQSLQQEHKEQIEQIEHKEQSLQQEHKEQSLQQEHKEQSLQQEHKEQSLQQEQIEQSLQQEQIERLNIIRKNKSLPENDVCFTPASSTCSPVMVTPVNQSPIIQILKKDNQNVINIDHNYF